MNRLDSTSFTAMSFLSWCASEVIWGCKARETRSLLPENSAVFFFTACARVISPKRERRVKLLIPCGGGKGTGNTRNRSESS